MLLVSLLLLALGVRTLSLPSTDTALEKRKSYPWIASFDAGDAKCSNTSLFTGPHTKDLNSKVEPRKGDCAAIDLQTGTSSGGPKVGDSWGSGSGREINIILAFMDEACGEYQVNITRVNSEPGFCVLVSDLSDLSSESGCEGGIDVGDPCYLLFGPTH